MYNKPKKYSMIATAVRYGAFPLISPVPDKIPEFAKSRKLGGVLHRPFFSKKFNVVLI
jgi:hypothetical protein